MVRRQGQPSARWPPRPVGATPAEGATPADGAAPARGTLRSARTIATRRHERHGDAPNATAAREDAHPSLTPRATSDSLGA